MDLAPAQIKAFPLFISSSKFWQCEAVSSITAKALERRKRLNSMKSCLCFSGSHKGVSVNQSPDLDQPRNMDFLWCVRIALPAVVLGINVIEVGNMGEQCWVLSLLPTLSGQGLHGAWCCLCFIVGRTGREGAELSGVLPEIVASISLLVCTLSV